MSSSIYIPKCRNGKYYYSIFRNSIYRVLNFERFMQYFAELPQGGGVLDYGSGDRPFEQLLATKFDRYIPADHPLANEKHTRRAEIDIVDDTIRMEDESVDCVVLTEVLEHVYQPGKALSEIFRVLKPGGRVIGTVPFVMNEHEIPWDFHRYTSYCLRNRFSDAGFEIQRLDYIGDMVGVMLSLNSKVWQIIPRGLRLLRLAPLAWAINLLIRLPEFCYYWLTKTPLNPQRVTSFRHCPLGFSFLLQKPVTSGE